MNNIAQLKDNGLKVTGPRLKILDLFETHADLHLSAEDVYRILLENGIEIGVATIYRVLTQFEQAGILLRHHFEIEKLQEQIASEHGFRVVDHALYMYGVCGDCQKKEKR